MYNINSHINVKIFSKNYPAKPGTFRYLINRISNYKLFNLILSEVTLLIVVAYYNFSDVNLINWNLIISLEQLWAALRKVVSVLESISYHNITNSKGGDV